MFIGHLPAGFLLTTYIQNKAKMQSYLFLGLFGSIFPDLDLIYFYWIDGRQHLHHSYWTHIPFYWLIISVLTSIFFLVIKKKHYLVPAWIFFGNIFLHLILDTFVGKIHWLFPFSSASYALFEVPNQYEFWVFNFILHWTFLVEIGVLFLAALVFWKRLKSPRFTEKKA